MQTDQKTESRGNDMSNVRFECSASTPALRFLDEQIKKAGFEYAAILYTSDRIILTGSDAQAFAEWFHHPKWNKKVEKTTFTTERGGGGYIEVDGYDFSFLRGLIE